MNMIMIMVIILMLVMMTMTKNQTTTMTLWSKYALFKYYYLVKKLPKQLGNARLKMFLAMDAFPNVLSCWIHLCYIKWHKEKCSQTIERFDGDELQKLKSSVSLLLEIISWVVESTTHYTLTQPKSMSKWPLWDSLQVFAPRENAWVVMGCRGCWINLC